MYRKIILVLITSINACILSSENIEISPLFSALVTGNMKYIKQESANFATLTPQEKKELLTYTQSMEKKYTILQSSHQSELLPTALASIFFFVWGGTSLILDSVRLSYITSEKDDGSNRDVNIFFTSKSLGLSIAMFGLALYLGARCIKKRTIEDKLNDIQTIKQYLNTARPHSTPYQSLM